MAQTKILITGLGSIGRRYARLLQERGGVKLIGLRSNRGSAPCGGVTDIYTWEEAASCGAKIAFITNPTAAHIETAIKCAELGMHLFIEKPLDMRLDRLPELKELVANKGLTAYVAYNLRFHPGVVELKDIVAREGFKSAEVRCSSWLPDWRPGTNHMESYSAKAGMGGGVVLDLSHDPDYTGYIFGLVTGIDGLARRASAVTVDAEDTADMTLRLAGGAAIPVHVDFCTPGPAVRTVKAATTVASYELDLVGGRLITEKDGNRYEKKYEINRDFTYKAEVEYFLENLGKPVMNSLDEAGALLSKLLELKRANGLV